ncbi:MAG: thioredoxin domain-containing protein [Sediminicola sp.]|tara:strand:- start:54943 stop:56982 length:2040 start_codon:yes stop_codon:yes gene_type:complete
MKHRHTNPLIDESSPYLLQHAHNPVYWEAWSPEVLERAQKENRPLLISIGYAACHWCHVMEKECFEDEAVAQVMNSLFVCIKIDREERPDIDHIYMDALQMMTGSGGWPLNIVALPDGSPFWGGTYLKKDDWISTLQQLATIYEREPEKIVDHAQRLADGIIAINLIEKNEGKPLFSLDRLESTVKNWSAHFDLFFGGHKRAPKFMMPSNLDFLLHYATLTKDAPIMEYVDTTLTRMAHGGIFDHIGGGFSRYAVDTKWHVPHFEKMLYDNGQLISLYAKAYAARKNDLYKKTAERTITFVTRELMHENGGFYSSLDADSTDAHGTLEEGAYYVWTDQTLQNLLGVHYPLFKEYYNINSYGFWEEDKYVLIRDASHKEVAERHGLGENDLEIIMEECRSILHKERDKRDRPRLDDKILTSWNALMLKGLIDAYRYFQNSSYLEMALKNAHFIVRHLQKEDGSLYHNHKNGKSTINGYLEDYAAVIDAFHGLYEVTFEEEWLWRAQQLLDHCLEKFRDPESDLFFFTNNTDPFVIRRTLEVLDNVVPASNSMMALNLFKMSKPFPDKGYGEMAEKMLLNVQESIGTNAQGHSNWLHMVLYLDFPFYELAILGPELQQKALGLRSAYVPNSTLLGAENGQSTLQLLQNRYVPDRTLIYNCLHGTCKLPTSDLQTVLREMTV